MAHRQLFNAGGNQTCVRVPTDSSTHRFGKTLEGLLQYAGPYLKTVFFLVFFGFISASVFAGPRFVPGQILIKPKAGVSETNVIGKLNRHGAKLHRTLRGFNVRVAAVSEANADAVLNALRNDPDIEFAERDYVAELTYVPNDPLVASGTEWHLSQIQAPLAWDITRGRSNVVVAVLDSGVTASQPDLMGQILDGYDFVNNDSNPTDDFGHGTAVAGTIVATGNNSTGVAGVAFGCRVLPVKVADNSGFASYSTIAQGIRYAVDHGARIINLSIAGSASSATLQDAINYAWNNNVVIVASAGNNANNVPQYPAACDHVVAVSATAADDSLASFSSYGSYVTLAAPGDNIWTTTRSTTSPFAAWRGTSFASPIVAAVAGLVASENPSLSNAKIVSLLEQTADDLGSVGRDESFGYGRVNAYRALVAASAEPGALPTVPPETSGGDQPPVVLLDTNAPTVSIVTGPKNNARLFSSEISLSGIASDDGAVDSVRVSVNGIPQSTSGTANWTAQVPLKAGLNTIRICSVDVAGNVSPEIIRTVTYVMMVPVTINTNGFGSVSPNLNGKLLEIGKTYTIRAVPGNGQVFAGWSGIDSQSQTLSFTMQPDMTLTANFVASPFPAVKGAFAGLLWDTNGVMPGNSGAFTLNVTPSGNFSGKLTVGGSRYGFSGQFDLNGNTTVAVRRPNLSPLNLQLSVDLTGGSDQMTGRVTDGAWVSELAGDRNVFNAKLNPATQAGLHNFILEQTENASAAASGASTIGKSGATRVKGKLSDGCPFTAGSIIAKNGDYPLYLSFNGGTETVIGWLNFPAQNPTANGSVLWVRAGTNAFAAQLQAASVP